MPAPQAPTAPARGGTLLPILFLLSGISGLLYEVVWFRMLVRVFGCTVHAVSTVLVVFMTGLALGSFIAARALRKRRGSLRLYGALEAGIGISAVISTLVMAALPSTFSAVVAALGDHANVIVAFRLLAASVVLLPPTLLMGATLPVLTGALSDGDEEASARRVGLLYGLNTLGAVVGVLASGFVFLALAGERRTVLAGALINLLVGACAAWLVAPTQGAGSARPEIEGAAAADATAERLRRRVLLLYAVSGFCALAYQVIWSRLLILLLGNSVYGFSSMLAVYLVGISLGSVAASRAVSRDTDALSALSMLQVGVSLLAILSLHIFTMIGVLRDDPKFTYSVLWSASDFWQLPLNAVLIVLPVTLLSGAMFPLVTRICAQGHDTASAIGQVYGYNTVGAILGSFLVGFLLLPALGTFHSFVLTSVLSFLLGVAAFLLIPSGKRARPGMLALGLGFVGLLVLVSQAPSDPFRTVLEARLPKNSKIIQHEEDTGATVTIVQRDDPRGFNATLSINGLHVSGTGFVGRFQAHMPLLFLPDPKKALFIGLGAGEAFCGSLDHGVDTTMIELLPTVLRWFPIFHPDGSSYLNRPNARVIINDGRNYLLGSKERFDLVVVDGTPPIFASGMVNLYSHEFTRIVSEHLSEDGLFTLWLPIYLFESDFWAVAHNFVDVFPQVVTWAEPSFQGMFIMGTKSKQALFDVSEETLAERIRARGVPSQVDPAFIKSRIVLGDAEMRRAAAAYPLVTDDRPYTEFPMFRFLAGEQLEVTNGFLARAKRP